jgi:hypothetical protein
MEPLHFVTVRITHLDQAWTLLSRIKQPRPSHLATKHTNEDQHADKDADDSNAGHVFVRVALYQPHSRHLSVLHFVDLAPFPDHSNSHHNDHQRHNHDDEYKRRNDQREGEARMFLNLFHAMTNEKEDLTDGRHYIDIVDISRHSFKIVALASEIHARDIIVVLSSVSTP